MFKEDEPELRRAAERQLRTEQASVTALIKTERGRKEEAGVEVGCKAAYSAKDMVTIG